MPSDPVVLPAAQPTYVLRGHQSQIHSLSFYAGNRRLLSGDGDGFVISWDVATKRPVAGWRAHSKAILGVASWPLASTSLRSDVARWKPYEEDDGDGRIITHGRDGRVAVWRLDAATERLMHTYVPPDRLEEVTAKPAMLHELAVGAVSFCAFSICEAPIDMTFADLSLVSNGDGIDSKGSRATAAAPCWPRRAPLLLAAPSAKNSEDTDIFYLPAGTRKSTVVAPKTGEPRLGMAMAVIISVSSSSGVLTLAVAHESGDLVIHQHSVITDSWMVRYRARPHSQPILSLCLHPLQRVCFSSGADGILARHPFADEDLLRSATANGEGTPLKVVQTKHSGQQGLAMRSDGRVFSSAGWDTKVRVYSAKTMKEIAVLKAHRQGCYVTSLAEVHEDEHEKSIVADNGKMIKKENGGSNTRENVSIRLDKVNRKYRLGLQIESFVTPPSSQDETAKWQDVTEKLIDLKQKRPERLHQMLDEYEAWASKQQNVYGDHKEAAADLGLLPADLTHAQFLVDILNEPDVKVKTEGLGRDESGADILVPATPEKSRAMTRYETKVRSTHWLAAGSKDGTISLWDIF